MSKFSHAQLARMGKCSRSAVTYAINGNGTLSPETRERLVALSNLDKQIDKYFKDPIFEKLLELALIKLPKRTKRFEEIRIWISNVKALHIYMRDGHCKNLSDFDAVCREDDPFEVVANKDFHTICTVAYQHTSNMKLTSFITDLIRFIKLITEE